MTDRLSLPDIARKCGMDLDTLRVWEVGGVLRRSADGRYDPFEVMRTWIKRTEQPEPQRDDRAAEIARLKQGIRYYVFALAGRDDGAAFRLKVAEYLSSGSKESITAAARRLGVSRKHFSETLQKLQQFPVPE